MGEERKYLLDYEVEAHGCLVGGLQQVVSMHPRGDYEVHVANLSTEPGADRPLLSVQIIITSADMDTAKALGRKTLSQYIDLLTFATNLKFEIRKLVRIIDWTHGLRERRCKQFQPFPGHELPYAVLNTDLFKSVEVLEEAEISDPLRRVLRWFARGVRSIYLDDQFQYFWFVVELLAQIEKAKDRVSDLCPKCRSPLYCEKCATHPTHRPYPKQAILALFKRTITDHPQEFFDVASAVRNCIMHGDDVKSIEGELGVELSTIVDKLGAVAWTAIYGSLRKSFKAEPSQERLALLQTNTYTHRVMSVAADLIVYGDPERPNLAHFAKPEISLVYEKRGGPTRSDAKSDT